jgi:Sulfatase
VDRLGRLSLLLLLLLASCGRRPAPHEGPIVLITFDSLRADVVGGLGGTPGLMPHLEGLLREADWGGRAVAASSWNGSAMASLLTGLRPWQHQVLWPGRARLLPELVTLPEALAASGYETVGYSSSLWTSRRLGYAQGFGNFGAFHGANAAEALSSLDGSRRFVWIHIPQPGVPYLRRDRFLSRLGPNTPPLPVKVLPRQLEPWFDPSVPLPPGKRRRFWALYRLNAAWADDRLCRLLESLRKSGQWDRTLLVVTANHGEEFGEKGQIFHGGNLGRQLLEIPLAVKLPEGFGRRIAPPDTVRVAAARIWATLVEAAGGEVPPAVAPSLFHQAPPGVLSELYLGNGINRFSLIEGDHQLTWESRFAPPDPEYYRPAPPPGVGERRNRDREILSVPSGAAVERLRAAFEATPPLTGRGRPRRTLEIWGARGGSTPVDDPERSAAMEQRLRQIWGAFGEGEPPPGEEGGRWYTGEPPSRKQGKSRVHSSAVRASGS